MEMESCLSGNSSHEYAPHLGASLCQPGQVAVESPESGSALYKSQEGSGCSLNVHNWVYAALALAVFQDLLEELKVVGEHKCHAALQPNAVEAPWPLL